MEYAGKTPSGTSKTTTTSSSPAIPTVTVVVASSAIAQGKELTASDLKTASFPSNVITSLIATGGSDYTSVAALTQTKHYAATNIIAGLPILSSMVTTSAAATIPTGSGLSTVLPNGYVAMSLPYNPTSGKGELEGEGTGGYIVAGDRVDILVEIDPIPNPNNVMGNMYWAYENVLVLAVGESSGAPSAASGGAASSSSAAPVTAPSLVMVELPKQDAADMSYLEDGANVTIQYLIVAQGDYPSSGTLAPTSTASPQTIYNGSGPTFFGG